MTNISAGAGAAAVVDEGTRAVLCTSAGAGEFDAIGTGFLCRKDNNDPSFFPLLLSSLIHVSLQIFVPWCHLVRLEIPPGPQFMCGRQSGHSAKPSAST